MATINTSPNYDGPDDADNKNNIRTGEVTQLRRIADALEEVIRLVKQDQEKYESYRKEKADEGNFADGR